MGAAPPEPDSEGSRSGPSGRRLRIAFVTDVFEGSRNGGAVSGRRFVEALRARHDVTVVAAGDDGPDRVGLPAFFVPGFRRLMEENGFPFAWPRRRSLEAALRRADLVHVQFPFPLGVAAARLAARIGVPLVAGHHVQPENLLLNLGLRSPRLAAALHRLSRRLVFDRADAVVCPTGFARDELLRHGLRAPVEVVSNGIPPAFCPGAALRPARWAGRYVVAAVGRLAREKRLDVVLEGVRRARLAPRIQLVLTGRGPEEARVRRMAAALPVPAEVGYLPDAGILDLLRSADLLVHASEVELEGMAVLEAMGCGLPALVAQGPLSASAGLAVGADFRFRAGDAADLANRLDALLPDDARRAAARGACLARAPGLAFERSVAQLEELYRRIARPPA